jgi:predicted RNase H-like nuclease (RuvC/YqgF family)
MNTKTVLKKIMTLLSAQEEVNMTFAKLADGTIVESPTFDVGETLEVISEDGTKSPAPDGTHELSLRDEEGNETLFKVVTEGGIIRERENVELEAETVEVEPLPNTTDEPEANKVEELEAEMPQEDEKEVTINLEDVAKKMEEMQYRIEELEKVLKAQEEEVKEEEMEEDEEEEMEDLPMLDGAPMESQKVSKFSKQTSGKVPSYQNSFLNKLYK